MRRKAIRTGFFRASICVAALLVLFTAWTGWYSGGLAVQTGARTSVVGFGNGLGVFAISEVGEQAQSGASLQRFDPHWDWWFKIAKTPDSFQLMVPLWVPTLVLVGLGVMVRPSRDQEGRCTACGYELQGVGGQVCPECGVKLG